MGFNAYGITQDMTGSKMLFAGIRFAAAGMIVLSVAHFSGRSFTTRKFIDWRFIIAFSLIISFSMSACRIVKAHGLQF